LGGREADDYFQRMVAGLIPESESAPQRVVSLVPAYTDSLVALGLGRCLAAATDRCPLPAELAGLPRVGDPESPRLADILASRPDLVLAGGETPQSILAELKSKDIPMRWMAPATVRGAVADLRDLVLLFASEAALQSVVWLDRSLDWLEQSRPERRSRGFCPQARGGPADNPTGWTTFSGETYPADLIALCGGENVFQDRTDGMYPQVSRNEVLSAAPDIILLPGDPFPFTREDAAAMQKSMPAIPAAQSDRVCLIDGRLLFWPGTKLGEAIRLLPDLLRAGG